MESEGGEAAYLLGKDKECEKAFRYAMEIVKSNEQSAFVERFLHMEKLMDEAEKLTPLEQLAEFRKQVNDVRQMYNGYVANPDVPGIVSDITDLSSQLDAYLQQACIEFQTQSNKQLKESREQILALKEMESLKDNQREQIDTLLGELSIERRGDSIDNLRDMVNTYSAFYLPQGTVNSIENRVKAMAESNAPAVSEETTTTVNSPSYTPTRLRMKTRITSRADLQAVIDQLTQLLGKVDDNSPVEFIF